MFSSFYLVLLSFSAFSAFENSVFSAKSWPFIQTVLCIRGKYFPAYTAVFSKSLQPSAFKLYFRRKTNFSSWFILLNNFTQQERFIQLRTPNWIIKRLSWTPQMFLLWLCLILKRNSWRIIWHWSELPFFLSCKELDWKIDTRLLPWCLTLD